MTLLERLLGHDQAATRELLNLCLPLTDAQLDHRFDAGWATLRQTFDHMIGNIEVWTDLMLGRAAGADSDKCSIPELIERLDAGYAEFAALALRIEHDGRLDDTWIDTLDDPPQEKSFGGAIGHVMTQNMHHRAELQHMLHRLPGLPFPISEIPEGDLMGWDRRTNG